MAVSLITDLAKQKTTSFDGTSDTDIGVKGVLSVANGGTGSSTILDASINLGLYEYADMYMEVITMSEEELATAFEAGMAAASK